jgi:hypothetical protein
MPEQGPPFSSGAQRIEVLSARNLRFSDWEKVILKELDTKTFSSFGELNEALIPEDISKAK